MNIVITGATGFIGRTLALRLARDGHRITGWVRDPITARSLLGPDCALVAVGDVDGLNAAVAAADAVVNLAGEPIVGGVMRGRWTRRHKAELRASRVSPTRAMVAAIRAAAATGRRPVFVSASAVGYYGDRGEESLSEDARGGSGFAARLCDEWEAAALEARGVAARVVIVRIGIVLGREGGVLAKLIPLTRAMLGGPIAGGAQWTPWIHLDDVVEAIVHSLGTPSVDGTVNVVAPNPVPQRELAHAIGRAVGRPAIIPAPRFAVRALLGEASSVLTASQRVVPDVLLATGFQFRHPDLDEALRDVTATPTVGLRRLRRGEAPDTAYTRARRPRYLLVARTELAAPLARVFPFFAAADNLQLLTPAAMAFSIQTPRPIEMAANTVIDYRLEVLGIPTRWRTVIERWSSPLPGDSEAIFVDAQHRGPYRAWWHEHRFHECAGHTVMEDVVYYAPPFGWLGAIVNRLMINGQLRRIFGYRAAMIRHRFGAAPSAPERMNDLHVSSLTSCPSGQTLGL
jgi:uncharacterized protein (TIGR01777 family)